MVSSQELYWLIMGAVILERGAELVISRRNAQRAFAAGAVERGLEHFPWMVLLHVSFLIACPLEVIYGSRPWTPWLGWACGISLILSMGLRYWAIATLGDRWNTRVICLPEAEAISGGPYRWIRHPNYLAVIVEFIALPLFHGAWVTALVFSVLNAWMLRVRIRVEEATLAEISGYEGLRDRPRLLPGGAEGESA